MNGQPVSTTFNSGTQLTATVNPTQPGTIDLQVLNPSPGPATSADLIADVAGGAPTLQVSPTDAARFLEQATFGATDGDIHNLELDRLSDVARRSSSPRSRRRWSPASSRP